jgi:DNA mismatch repair ATPase MutS
MLDLIAYELLKNKLGKHHQDIFLIHEHLGQLDSAIAIASYRQSMADYCLPELDFSSSAQAYIRGSGFRHPLLTDAVPNDFDTTEPVLLTGSNASGKSTFLKTIALNAILAQSICTSTCNRYSASAFRIYSSMAIADNIFAGESYFIAEIKSLKRIADADASKQPLLCVIDEILRGTNTVERIAASSELLRYLATKNTLCLAATHDIELCTLLNEHYRLLHFKETVTSDGQVIFDYMLRDGPANTRNALKLLGSLGFDQKIVEQANQRANQYLSNGTWI